MCDNDRDEFDALLAAHFKSGEETVEPQEGRHLTVGTLLLYIDGKLNKGDSENARMHLVNCQTCTNMLVETRNTKHEAEKHWKQQIPLEIPEKPNRWRGLTVFAFAIAATLLVVVINQRKELHHNELTIKGQSQVTRDLRANLQAAELKLNAGNTTPTTSGLQSDGPGQKRFVIVLGSNLYRDGKGTTFLASPVSKQDEKWLVPGSRGRLELVASISDAITQMKQGSQLLGGNDVAVPVTVSMISPIATFITSRIPIFRWKLSSASLVPSVSNSFRLTIQTLEPSAVATVMVSRKNGEWVASTYDAEGTRLAYRFHVSTSNIDGVTIWEVEPPGSLSFNAGETYRWWVDAVGDGSPTAKPLGTSDRIAKFTLPNPAAEADLLRNRQKFASSHQALGIYYGSHGYFDAAEAELRLEPDSNENARRLIAELRRLH